MRILWLKTELLHPVDKGGKIRTYAMLRELAREHEVTYLTLDDGQAAPDAAERAREYCTRLERIPFSPAPKGSARFYAELAGNLLSPLPYAIAKYRSAAMRRRIGELLAEEAYDVLVCDFLSPSLNVPEGLSIPTVLFQHNVEAQIWERHAANARNPIARRYFAEQHRRMVSHERAECRRFDHVIAVSEEDATLMRERYGVRSVSAVPTGVDIAYFDPSPSAVPEPGRIVFTGSMDWLPNQDAIRWFCAEVMPEVVRRVPDARLSVVGRNPPSSLVGADGAGARVEVTGRVPDVRPYLEAASVVVVPIRIGGGTRLKIYEAMAMGRPVVSTTIGAEGLPVTHGENIVIADEPRELAAAIADLLADPARARELGERSRTWVREHFSWSAVAARFAQECERVVERSRSGRVVVTA